MSTATFLRRLGSPFLHGRGDRANSKSCKAAARRRTSPRLEGLEARVALSTVLVGSTGGGVVSATSTGRLTMGELRAVTAQVERTVLRLGRTHNMGTASVRLAHIASEIPGGLQQLAPVWQQDLASDNPQLPGSGRAFDRQLLSDLKQDVAAAVAMGEVRLTGRGAAAYLASAVAPQASLDSVTVFNGTGFGITVSASLNTTNRTLPARTIANGASSLFDFGSTTNNFISINVSRTGGGQPPPSGTILSRPVTGYNGKMFTVSVLGGRFAFSV